MENLIVVLSGPSGAGKGTIYKKILEKRENVYRCVSSTTREPRIGEIQGFDYDFITIEKFKQREKQSYFLETTFYNGNYYGTPNPNIQTSNKNDLFFDLNAEGGMKIKQAYPEAILIYIMPPNLEQLKKQLGNRGNKRLELGKQEVQIALQYDWLIINKNPTEAANEVIQIMEIVRKSKMQNSWNKNFVEKFY